MEWFGRNPVGGERQLADVEAVLDELREQHGCSAIGVHGFCWGGWFAVNQTAKGKVGRLLGACSMCRVNLKLAHYVQCGHVMLTGGQLLCMTDSF